MQLAIRGNSSNKFFQILWNILEDTVNPFCYNLLIWNIIFNYFLKLWWQSILTASYPEGEFPSCSSIKSPHSSETSCWHIQEHKKYWGVMGSACLLLSIPSQISTLFSWVKRVVFTLCKSELQSREKTYCSMWSVTIMMSIQSELWSKVQCYEVLLTCIVF